jgi:radical SAM protein with 4Fe4S-binding SPASM domain
MKKTVTLVHKNCRRGCPLCAYGPADPIDYGVIADTAAKLMERGYPVHLYDFHVNARSLEIFRLTGQFEGENPEWLNVTSDFSPEGSDLDYVNSLNTTVVISLHGSSREMHRQAGGTDDFDEIVRFIRSFHGRFALDLGINYVVSRLNIDDIEDMMRFCEKERAIGFVEFIPFGFAGNARHALGRDAVLSLSDSWRAYSTIMSFHGKMPFHVELDACWGPDFEYNPGKKCWFFAKPLAGRFCNAGVNHVALRMHDMKLFPCPCMIEMDELSTGSFDGGDLHIEGNWMEDPGMFGQPCSDCELYGSCRGGCRIPAIIDSASGGGPVDRFAGFLRCLHVLGKNRQRL